MVGLEHVPNLADVMELQILVVVDEKFPGRTVGMVWYSRV